MEPTPGLLREDDDRPLPTILAELSRAGASGRLAVSSREGRRELYLVDGELRAARSEIESEKLGSWLVGHKVISIQDKAIGLMHQGSSVSSPFGHVLVNRGVIDQGRLEEQLQRLALAILERATVTPRSRVVLIPGKAKGQLDTLPNISTPQLLLLAARAFPNLQVKRTLVGRQQEQAWLARPLQTLLTDLELTDDERKTLETLRETRSLQDLPGATGLSADGLTAALYSLTTAGAVMVGSVPSVAPERSAAAPQPQAPRPAAPRQDVTTEQRQERELILRLVASVGERNHYENLGLEIGATYAQITEAWDRLKLRFLPDRAREPHLRDLRQQLHVIYQRLEEGFETLSEPRTRMMYDRIVRTDGMHSARGATAPAGLPPGAQEVLARTKEPVELARQLAEKAQEAIASGDLFNAHRLLEMACETDPQPVLLVRLAKLMLFNPNWASRALDKVRQAIDLDPSYVDAWLLLAEFWRRRQHRERQRKALERAVAADPTHVEAVELYRQLVGDEAAASFLTRAQRQ